MPTFLQGLRAKRAPNECDIFWGGLLGRLNRTVYHPGMRKTFSLNEKVEALRWLLGAKELSILQISERIGVSRDDIENRPVAAQGLADSEMIGWLSIHHGPNGDWPDLISKYRGDWRFFSGVIKGYYKFDFLELRGSPIRKANYLLLAFRAPTLWASMYEPNEPFVSTLSLTKMVARVIFRLIRLKIFLSSATRNRL